MMSLHGLSSAGQAESYYQTVNDYYAENDEELAAGEEPEEEEGEGIETDNGEHLRSAFLGKGASILGLKEFDKERFGELLRGKISEEKVVGRLGAGGEIQHRPGWDATLSAPKSVSIMALVAGDKRVIDAHHDAVEKTIAFLEKDYAFTRENDGKWLKTDNLTVAAFTHSASRNLDPQLHTHNVILNVTQDGNDRWRSLETKALYGDQKLAGHVYRSYLAHTLSQELGYEIIPGKDGAFEIAGVSDDLIKTMSSRRKEIERIALEKGYEDAKGKEQAALMTRRSKQKASRASLEAAWKELAKEHLPALKALIPDASRAQERGAERDSAPDNPDRTPEEREPGNNPEQQPTRPTKAHDSALYDVRLAIKHLTTYEAVVSKQDIISFALANISGDYSYDHLEAALHQVVKDREIMPSLTQEDAFTTPTALRRESLALNMMEQGRGDAKKPIFKKPILREKALESHIRKMRENAELHGGPAPNEGQADGLRVILTTKDQFVGIQGYAGTGKTFLWSEARQLAESARHSIKGFAPTGSAARKLMEDSGIQSQTIDSFLYKHRQVLEGRGRITAKNEVWVIDEAGLSNARHVLDMMILARKAGARVVFQGDGSQLGAIEWGKLFKLLQDNGMATARLDEILRQKDIEVKQAVYSVLDRDYHKAIAHLGERVQVHKDRITPLVKDLMKLSPAEREKALVVIPDLETRAKATAAIRRQLQERGELGKDSLSVDVLKDARLSDPQKGDGRFYKENMVVQFGADLKTLGIKKGERFTVAQDGKINTVTLKREDGRTVDWDPAVAGSRKHAVDVYRQDPISIAEGDRIKWTKSLKALGMANNDSGHITSIDKEKGTMTVAWEKSGKTTTKTHDLKDHRNFDHDYVHTAFVSQGLDSKHVFTIAESWRRNLVNEKSFYVKLSRTKDKINVYTDDKGKLTKAIARKAEKTSALESQKGQRHQFNQKTPELSWVEKLINAVKERAPSRQQEHASAERKPPQKQPEHTHSRGRGKGRGGPELEM